MPYWATFRLELVKTIVMLDFKTFNVSKCNISCKKKCFLNVGLKLFYLAIFALEIEEATVLWLFYISILKSFQTKFCPPQKKSLNVEPKLFN